MNTPLAKYLASHGLTQTAFAVRSGLDQATVSRLCRGESRPSFTTILKIEAATAGQIRPADLNNADAFRENQPRSVAK